MNAEHLYLHVPFCARRCVYCDFSIAVRSPTPVDEYLRALQQELEARHAESELDLSTLYFGGGTPSKLGGDGVARLMDLVRRFAALRADAEITLEANPEDVGPEAVQAWRAAGINRVSLGVQSFADPVLTWMHRTHDAHTARRAIEVLREAGLENISIDLIFATPNTVPRSWDQDLDEALALQLPHISLYGLTVESHTPLGRWVAGQDVAEAPEEAFEGEFLRAHTRLTDAGFEHYEVSNYARPNRHSKHNWAYWKRRPYAGLGPSAHEFDGNVRRWNTSAYAHWLSRLTSGQDSVAGCEELGNDQIVAEEVYLALRTMDGLVIAPFEVEQSRRWIAAGWATLGDETRLQLTASGWLRLDSIAGALTMLRSR